MLEILARQPIHFAGTFRVFDINFDGYSDFSVLGEFGPTWGRQLWWIYEPVSGTFVQDELTRELGQSGNNGYRIDSEKHAIQMENLMAGCPPLVTRYRVEDNHLTKVHEVIGKQMIEGDAPRGNIPAGIRCTVTISDLADGSMCVIQIRRFVR